MPTLTPILPAEVVDDEIRLKQASGRLGVPFVRLFNRTIPATVLQRIPELVARKEQIVAYDESRLVSGRKILRLAVAEPALLEKEAPAVVTELHVTGGYVIEVALTPKRDLEAILQRYHPTTNPPIIINPPKPLQRPEKPQSPPPASSQTKLEPEVIDLVHRTIPHDVLERIPEETAKKYRVVVFDAFDEGQTIHVAADQPENPQVEELLAFIRQRNHLKLVIHRASAASIEAALAQYVRLPVASSGLKKTPPAAGLKPAHLAKPIQPLKPNQTATGEPGSPPQAPPVGELPAPRLSGEVSEPAQGIRNGGRTAIVRAEDLETLDLHVPKDQAKPLIPLNADVERDLNAIVGGPVNSIDDLQAMVKTGFIPKIVGAVLLLAIKMGASDIHVQADEVNVLIRFRIDGILRDILLVPISLQAPIISRIKILAKMKIDEQRIPQDGRFDVSINDHDVDLRVSTFPTVRGEKVVMRLLDKSTGLLKLENLGVMGSRLESLRAQIHKPYGVVLATGPTGSGKSTSLYAVLQEIAGPAVNVVTLEDPVEYEIPGINQAQIKPKIGFGFAEGLRAILRQDPNIIMVGEIRDLETAQMMTHAALTGHLVLSTLHTNDASGALPRLMNMGVEPFLITSAMNAILAQRLVRKLCQECKIPWDPSVEVAGSTKAKLQSPSPELALARAKKLTFYKPKGCEACTNGFRGRVGIYEVLVMSEAIEELAVKKAPASEIEQAAIEAGMVTMEQDGILKALAGLTTLEEVFRVIKVE
jgi:type II secretory ATPase GspE/PulE/Tfp pilus assembly ATPase PilB-like protein